jgi:hypothetical protein
MIEAWIKLEQLFKYTLAQGELHHPKRQDAKQPALMSGPFIMECRMPQVP